MYLKFILFAIHVLTIGCYGSIVENINRCLQTEPTPTKRASAIDCLENHPGIENYVNGYDNLYLYDLKVIESRPLNGTVRILWNKLQKPLASSVDVICQQIFKEEKVLRVLVYIRQTNYSILIPVEDELIIRTYNAVNGDSRFVEPVKYPKPKEPCSSPCGKNAKCSSFYGRSKCVCIDHSYGDPLEECIPYCVGTSVCGFNFPETRPENTAVARVRCSKTQQSDENQSATDNHHAPDYIYASILCRLNRNEANFLKSSVVLTPCGATVNSVISAASKGNFTGEKFDQYTSYIQALTVNSSSLNVEEVEGIVNFLDNTLQRSQSQFLRIRASTSFRSIALIVSQLAEGYWNGTSNPDPNQNSYKLQLKLAEDFPRVSLESTFIGRNVSEFEIETPTFTLMRINYDLENSTNAEFVPAIRNQNGFLSRPLTLQVPASVIDQSTEDFEGSSAPSQRASYVYYKTNTFFPSNETVFNILSVNLGLNESLTSNFAEPISIKHQNIPKTSDEPLKGNSLLIKKTVHECVFWNFTLSKWSPDGCCLNRSANPPQCLCNHLTNFALLVKSENVPMDTVLSTVSIVGCSLSIIGLGITITLLSQKKDLRKSRPAKTLLHLCCSLAVAYFVFVSGVSNAVGNQEACTLVAVLLHYFFLVAMCWMAIYSFEMYNALVTVFTDYKAGFFKKTVIFAYVVPAIVVTLSVGISSLMPGPKANNVCDGQNKPSILNYRLENQCWITGNSLYFGFLLPVGIMVVYNLIVFLLVTKELKQQNNGMINVRRSTIDSLIIAVTMTCIMGLTWILGFLLLLAREEASYAALSWIFAITNTLQGFGIFLLTSVRREDMRNIWWIPLKRVICFGQDTSKSNISYASTLASKSVSFRQNRTKSSLYSHKAPKELS